MNDHINVPVASPVQPAIMGAETEPIPKRNVHKPIIAPAFCLEKKSEAQAAYIDQQAP